MMLEAIIGMMGRGNLLLDVYSGASYAFSVRRVRTAYVGSCVRVRRSSDNTEQDIGFVGNDVDTASLLSFVGVGNGFITKWYDQSGNSRDLIQATTTSQPRIVISGSLQTVNSKTALTTASGGTAFMDFSPSASSTNPFCNFSVIKRSASATQGAHIRNTAGTAYNFIFDSDNRFYSHSASDLLVSTGTDTSTSQLLLTSLFVTAFKRQYKNGVQITSSLSSAGGGVLARVVIGAGFCQEFIGYTTDVSANQTQIESDINTYYTIF